MTVIIDLIGSTIVRAAMLIIMITLTITLSNALYKSATNQNTTELISTVQDVMHKDLMGVDMSKGISGTSTRVSFYAYEDSTMTAENHIMYESMRDNSTGLYKLYRVEGSNWYRVANNLVSGNIFTYLYRNSKISSIHTKLCMPSISSTDTTYASTEFTVNPFNL